MAEVSKVADATKAVGSGAPVVVDIGKKPRKAIKRLRQGKGKLMDQVNGCIQELRAGGTISANAQPVIIVVRQKRSASKMLPSNFWPMS